MSSVTKPHRYDSDVLGYCADKQTSGKAGVIAIAGHLHDTAGAGGREWAVKKGGKKTQVFCASRYFLRSPQNC